MIVHRVEFEINVARLDKGTIAIIQTVRRASRTIFTKGVALEASGSLTQSGQNSLLRSPWLFLGLTLGPEP